MLGYGLSNLGSGLRMKFNYATKRMTNYEYQRNLLLGLSSILLILLMILSLSLVFKRERVIILPPELKREFWVEGNRFSSEYLEEMAAYFLHLSLDLSFETLPFNTDILLRYADSETGSYIKEKYEKDLQKLKKSGARTSFEVKELHVYPNKNIVRATGVLYKYVGTKRIGESKEAYEVKFRTYRGRLFFKSINKVEEKNEES